jgi:GDP-4-dehydro-6-deoxy-D-mannose reductase
VSDRGPILVTGATGFAGGHLVEHLAGASRVIAWGRSAPIEELARVAEWQTVDLLDREQVSRAMAAIRPASVYHLAGATQVAESWQDTARPLRSNVLAAAHVLDAIHREKVVCRILLAGSSAVYAPADTPVREDGALAPASPYALSKLAQEQLAVRACRDDRLDIVIARPFNHTGPRQTPSFVAPAMARQMALIERGLVEPVIRVGNLDARRDLSDVRDVVRAYSALMERGRTGEFYNVGSGVGHSIRSLIDALVSRSKTPVRIETDPARLRPAETPYPVADTTRLRAETGWQPQWSFERMLDDLLAYWRGQVRSAKFKVEK